MQIPKLTNLKNDELRTALKNLKVKECEVISDVVLHVAELDVRGYYRDLGYSSLFSYLTQELGYSEGAAQRRIQAARCLREHPEVYGKLRQGTLNLCTVSEVYRVPSKEQSRLLLEAEGKSKREVQHLVAKVLPSAPPKRETVREVSPPPDFARDSLCSFNLYTGLRLASHWAKSVRRSLSTESKRSRERRSAATRAGSIN
jgi:hypothetical protein